MQAGFTSNLPLFPEQASTVAKDVDALYLFLTVVSGFFTVLIFTLIFYFAIKYRRRSEDEIPQPFEGSLALEAVWIIVPLAISMVMFFWGVNVFFKIARAPVTSDAIDIYVVGKRWMWKLQHLDGQREINQLHVPYGRPVRLIMTSEDVIHSFFVPAFRIKADVMPGRYSRTWFQATKPGVYHLFCAEYCGTKHSEMIGEVTVMEPAEYETWLSGGTGAVSLAAAGAKLFQDLACNNCHRDDAQARGPQLKELFGKPVKLQDGSTVIADEGYLRESILNPTAKVVEGFEPVMPTFQGLVTEEQLLQLIAYIKSLNPPKAPPAQAGPPQAGKAPEPKTAPPTGKTPQPKTTPSKP